MGPDAMIFIFWMLSFKPLFHSPLSLSSRDSLALLHFLPLEWYHLHIWGFPGSTSGKEPACQCRRHKRHRFDPWVGKIPWRRAWQQLQYSCLENALDRRAWQATVHRVTHSRVWLKWWGTAQRILLFLLHKWNNRGRIKFYSFYLPNIPAPFYIVNSQAPWT